MVSEVVDTTIKARYDTLTSPRDSYLNRARRCSEYSIPHLVPPEGHSDVSELPTPYNSLPARGVNHLASKLNLALFPANTPIFRLAIDDFALKKLTQRDGMRAEVEKALNAIERTVMNEFETTAIRTSTQEALKHLLVAGNVLLFLHPEGGIRVFRLDRYVVKRDPMGNVLEIIVKENLSPMEVPENIRDLALGESSKEGRSRNSPENTVELYTYIKREQRMWTVKQEINGVRIPESAGTYPLDKSPWIPLRYISVENEDYGRSFVEEYLGDIISLEGLTKAIVQGSAAAAKVLFMVAPNGTTKKKILSASESGDIVDGKADEVSVLQIQKQADFSVALQTIDRLSESLSYSFQLNSAIQRNGERVTAEEIRYMAQELDASNGGIHSLLSQELQLPLIRTTMHMMEKKGKLPALPKGLVRPAITTGIEALGRGYDKAKLSELLQMLAPLGEEVLQKYLNIPDYITRSGTSIGMDMDGLVRTAEEVAEMEQQEQMQALMQQGLPNLINQAGSAMAAQPAQ